jgi:sulfur carrier protein
MMGTEVVESEIALMVNGVERLVPTGSTLADLLASLGLDPRVIVVERNGVIARDRATFASLALAPNDTLEIVHFVGGG